jgi:hypothetical protein
MARAALSSIGSPKQGSGSAFRLADCNPVELGFVDALSHMNFGAHESRGRRRRILSKLRGSQGPCFSIGREAAPFRCPGQGGEYDQRGPLKRRHVFALAQQSIGKEADNIEENEFTGEDVDPPHYSVELTDRAAIGAAVFDVQMRYGISDPQATR